ncbi:MAG TPA: hypothetical protein VMT85_03760 [Thermoanaerobaculia bacterium]|nr:hypothetical protein [Thermoanaerobaculia bacterium]
MSVAAPSAGAIQRGDLLFTAAPGALDELPQPFVVAGRLPRLLRQLQARDPDVAILGFGLGAVGALMLEQRPGMRLVGVEPDQALASAIPEPLRRRVEIESIDALTFLRRTRRRFDLVFDDCFVLAGGDAVRPAELTRHAGLVARRLRAGGVYVRNLLPGPGLSVADQSRDLSSRFPHVALRTFREWENVFAVASARPIRSGWRSRLY